MIRRRSVLRPSGDSQGLKPWRMLSASALTLAPSAISPLLNQSILIRTLVILATMASIPSNLAAADEPAVSLRPYRVRINIAVEPTAALPASTTETLRGEVRDLGARYLGDGWQIEINVEPAESADPQARLVRITPAELRESSKSLDRLYLLSIVPEGSGFEITGLEWETTLETLSRAAPRFVSDRRDLARVAWQVVQSLFRPLAELQISRKKGEPPRLEAKAAALGWPDPAFEPLKVARQWEPFYRYLTAERELQKVQPIPWTFLQAKQATLTTAELDVVTGLRAPFSARKRRIETWALGVRAPADSTRLTIRTRGKVPRPLAGVEVRVAADPKSEPIVLVTNRLGEVTVRRSASPQPVWLQVYSGQELLAKVPYVPGIRAAEVLDVPDDAVRLEVEGRIAVLQAELIDVVARRISLIATARARAKAGDLDQVKLQLAQLDDLKAPASFGAELETIRQSGTQRARKEKNRAAEFRIKTLCDNTQELISVYLNPEKIKQLDDEMTELGMAAKDGRDALLELEKRKAAPAPEVKGKPSAKPKPSAPETAPAAPAKPAPPAFESPGFA